MTENTKQLKRWEKGESLTAKKLNSPVEAVNRLNQKPNNSRRRQSSGRQSKVTRFIIDSVEGDYLKCHEPDSSISVKVAKPYLLRNSITSRDGISYSYTNETERVATQSSETETQVIVPSYFPTDQIYAINVIKQGSGVAESAELLSFVDLNTDARAWAKKAE